MPNSKVVGYTKTRGMFPIYCENMLIVKLNEYYATQGVFNIH